MRNANTPYPLPSICEGGSAWKEETFSDRRKRRSLLKKKVVRNCPKDNTKDFGDATKKGHLKHMAKGGLAGEILKKMKQSSKGSKNKKRWNN